MKRFAIIILIFLFNLPPVFSEDSKVQSPTISFRSKVYDFESKKFIYTENHTEHYKNGSHIYSIIEYKDPSGKTFARKKIEFGKKRTQPDFTMEDYRTGYLDKSVLINASTQEFSIEHRRSESEPLKKEKLKIPGLVVVDGGFDYFIRDDFDTIAKGNLIKGQFLLVNRLDYFVCRVRKVSDNKYKGRDATVLVLQPENFVLRALADKIIVTYDTKTHRLLEYIGISNLRDSGGEDFPKVKIVFEYPKDFLD
jgi:hypothetical protein